MNEIEEESLSELIKGCSFHKVKAKYIKLYRVDLVNEQDFKVS